MSRPSVAIVGTRGYPSYYGGFETAVRRLAPYLVDDGWDVTVYGRHGATIDDDPRKDLRVHTPVTRGLEKQSLSTLSYGLTASLDIRRNRPDVALVMNVANGFWLPLLRNAGVPTLVNVDGIEWDRQKWGRLAKAAFRRGARLTAKYADNLVFDAEAIGDRWRRDFGVTRGVYIPYGGDVPGELSFDEKFEPGSYVLFVARFVPENSFFEFLDAARVLAETTDVVIVGSSGYEGDPDERVRQLAKDHPRVHWLGRVSDDDRLFALWQNAGVYFHGHSVGGTNPALVQAMACGAPIVARDTVYNREVLAGTGQLVSADSKEIASAVREMMSSRTRENYRDRARERAQADFSWSGVCDAYSKALRVLVRA